MNIMNIKAYTYDKNGNEVLIEGEFVFRTNDPEEYIQDVVIRTADGNLVYVDEQDVVAGVQAINKYMQGVSK